MFSALNHPKPPWLCHVIKPQEDFHEQVEVSVRFLCETLLVLAPLMPSPCLSVLPLCTFMHLGPTWGLMWKSWGSCIFVRHSLPLPCGILSLCIFLHLDPKLHETSTLLPHVDPPHFYVPSSNGHVVGSTHWRMLPTLTIRGQCLHCFHPLKVLMALTRNVLKGS
jgi:hypothetical protein